MERCEEDIARARKFMEDLSLYETCQDGLYSGRGCSASRRELLEDAQRAIAAHMTAEPRGKRMNGTVAPPGDAHPAAAASGKVYQAAAAPQSRSLNGNSRGGGQEPGCCEEGLCTRSEVALPCYGGFADKGRRYSSESARHSAGSAYEGVYVPKPAGSYPGPPGSRAHAGPEGKYNAASPRASLAASCQEQLSRFSSPRSSLGSSGAPGYEKFSSPRASLVVPGQEKYTSPRASLVQYEGSALSPRSSYASTASDTSKHSSPRASLNSYDCGSKPSSNRTSGISMGYDQRHISPRSSTASQYSCTISPRSSYSDSRYGPSGNPELDGAGGPGLPMVSPRSSLCSQDGRTGAVGNCNPSVISPRSSISSHSSRGSMSAYPELQLPSPRSSMLGPSLQEENTTQEHGDAYPRHEQQHPAASNPDSASGALAAYTYSPTKGSASAPKFKLPYQVTPSRESGPSQAERRLEALTLELEKELEMHMKKEYFGICIKCGKGVYGASQACQAMGNLYHTNCFTCCSCGRRLRGKAFYNVNGKVYCEEDFLYSGFQQTADKCFVCGHLIMEMILQALGKSYHPGCFRCVVCNECLDGVPFTVDVENNIYCVKDYHTVFAPKCASCNQPILPAQGSEETIRVVSMDRDYHVECYHCEDCGLQLNDEEGHRCYPLEGHLLCHGCHIRRLNIKVPPHPPPSYPMHVTEL
ncbi:Wilms tumor protein 1-interacting protein isoform X1 [Terrapene carolina triunguis]|uniref:WT1 interacting protein n=1 Tax=Terrapene triunguis TaxID=2587831 RepID=A0A674KGM5_9SAUR|nr:Wilms tumor protein 1-interacting protein isoform X1 [Terrapene carolina triunguis]